MKRAKTRKYAIAFVVVALVSVAYIFKLVRTFDWSPRNEFGIARSIIYIAMFSIWGLYLHMRIVQKQVRHYLSYIAALTVFWIAIRTIKFSFYLSPEITQALWYLYYLPIIFIPLFILLVSILLGKPEGYRLPKIAMTLFIPACLLLILVLTNDIHQLAFSFPADAPVYSDDEYKHEIVYYIILVWSMVCTLTAFVNIAIKCRIPGSRKLIALPFIPISILTIYGVLYVINFPFIKLYINDFTVVFCLLIAAALESLLQCGLIQSNTHYGELFQMADINAKIFDENYNLLLSSTDNETLSKETIQQTKTAPVQLDGGNRLLGAPIKGGYVIWSENVSELTDVLDELATARNDLTEETSLLRENYNTERRIHHLYEQNRLYDEIHSQTSSQISLLADLLKEFDDESDNDKKLRLLRKMIVIGVYLKRRSNLVFIGEQSPVLDERELALCFEETMNNLELSEVECGCYINLGGSVSLADATAAFDFYELVAEATYDSLRSLLIRIYKNDGETIISISIVSDADLSFLETAHVSLLRDEEGVCSLTLHIPEGGVH